MESNSRLVSVIMPVYNGEKCIGRMVESIINQTYKNWELIIIDDGSTDASDAIIQKYQESDKRIKLISKANGGVSSARNVGLSRAKGEYIAFADADDEVLKGWLENLYKGIGNSDVCIAGVIRKRQGNDISKCYAEKTDNLEELCNKLISKFLFGYPVIKLFKREIIEKYNIRFDETLKWREDDLFFANYLERIKSFSQIENCDYIYYLPPSNKNYGSSSTQCIVPYMQSFKRIFNGDIPYEICKLQEWSVKGEVEQYLLTGKKLTKELREIYYHVYDKLEPNFSVKRKLWNIIIMINRFSPKMSKLLIDFNIKSQRKQQV